MSNWINEAIGNNSRDVLMGTLQNIINTHRVEGFHDVEIYHIILGMCEATDNEVIQQMWPLYDYWLGYLLDWDDEMEVGV